MHPADMGFFAASGFLAGIGIAAGVPPWVPVFAVAVLVVLGRKVLMPALVIIVCVAPVGWGYAHLRAGIAGVNLPDKNVFRVTVSDQPAMRETYQDVMVDLNEPFSGRIVLRTGRYPGLAYGDILTVSGTISSVNEGSYNAGRGAAGIVYFPEIRRAGEITTLKSRLFVLKRSFELNVERALPEKEASFLNGILLGERGAFSSELREQLRKSGTTHLVALSGYNISIIAWLVCAALMRMRVGRRRAYLLSVAFICLFVVMTGAQASVVRAAIIGSIFLIGAVAGEIRGERNIIVFAAAAMALFEPNIVIDAAFQLSFLAFVGIVYVAPALRSRFNMESGGTSALLKENGISTIAAQVMVIPVLLNVFGGFSLISFLTNLLITAFIPATMLLGFIAGLAGYASDIAAQVPGLIAQALLAYELHVIGLSAKFPFMLSSAMPPLTVTAYYISILALTSYYYPKPPRMRGSWLWKNAFR